jgi:putative transcriptional regulator
MNAGVGLDGSLRSLMRAGEANKALRLLAATAVALRAGSDFMQGPADPLGGALLADETPATLGAEVLANTLSLIDQAEAAERQAVGMALENRPFAHELLDLPAPVRDAALKSLQRRNWSFGGFGIRRLPLAASGGAITELVRVEPGRGAAEHGHVADELTLVLTGAYSDGHGLYRPGELAYAGPGFMHVPKAEPGEVCYLMLTAFGQARFTGQIGLLQRLTGFPWQPRIDEDE